MVVLDMAVAGVGIATVASQFLSAILVLIVLMRAEDSYRLNLGKISFNKDILFSIVRIGLPAGLQSVLYSVSNLVIQSSINALGTDTIAAWSAYGKIDALFWMIMSAYGVAITTFVGQNYGAGKYDRIKKSVRVCTGMAIGSAIALSVLLMLFGDIVYRLFTMIQPSLRLVCRCCTI